MIAIGERINGMFTDVKQALADKDPKPIIDLARRQTAAGAAYLDINVGTAAADQEALGPDPAVELDQMFPGLRGSPAEAREVVSLLREAGSLPVRDVLLAFPAGRRAFVRMSLVWLAKAGVVDWLPAA